MLSHLQIAGRYFNYYLASKTLNSIDSPTIYSLINQTLEDGRTYYAFRELEALRRHLHKREEIIEITDLGAGSRVSNKKYKSIDQIAKSALSPPAKAQILFRLCQHIQPSRILEFGTSLGLSALYMHKGCSSAKLITVEGDPAIAKLALQYFEAENADIQLINCSFDEALTKSQIKNEVFDLIYIDGNHTEKATIEYVNSLYENLNDEGVIILDDIYWSTGMMHVWKKLAIDPRFAFSVDLFDYGVLIKKPKHLKHESYTIIKRKKKPFSLGILG